MSAIINKSENILFFKKLYGQKLNTPAPCFPETLILQRQQQPPEHSDAPPETLTGNYQGGLFHQLIYFFAEFCNPLEYT